MTSRIARFCCLVMGLYLSAFVHAQVSSVEVSVDKNPVMLDEAFQLIVVANGELSSDQLDLSALEKDFRIAGTSVSRSTQMINFSTSYTTTWTTRLFPKSVGQFTIPAISVDGVSGNSFTVTVLPVSQGQGAQARDFYVSAEVDTDTVYLHQQVRYTLKLFLAKDIQRGSLEAPQLDGAVVKQLGEDKEYQDIQNGVRYRVIERNYAIIPQSSGQFELNGPLFQGEVLAGGGRQGFGFINRTQNISRVGPSINLTVKPIPEAYSYHWLPSEFVQLNDEWQGDLNNLRVGEPITRTFTLTAAGLVEEQLPDIDANYHPSFKTYPDQASSSTIDQDNLLFAQRVQSVAIIPEKAGTFVLPEIKLPWFNVLTGETEFATIAAQSVQVLPAATQMTQSNAPPTSVETRSSSTKLLTPNKPSTQPNWLNSVSMWWLGLAVLMTSGLTGALGFFAGRTSTNNKATTNKAASSDPVSWSLDAIVKAAKQADIDQLSKLLPPWLEHISGQSVVSIESSLSALSPAAKHEWEQLLASRYAKSKTSWQANNFINAIRAINKQNNKDAQNSLSLYPE